MEFEIKHTKIQIGFWFAFVLAYLLCIHASPVLKYAVLFSLLHECGHLSAFVFYRIRPQKIRLGLTGMTIRFQEGSSLSYKQERWIAFAGPLVNFSALGLFLLCALFSKKKIWLVLAVINGLIGFLNCLPVFSLDGGRILHSILSERVEDVQLVLNIEKGVSFGIVFVTMGFGFFILLRSSYNFSLLLLSFYFIFALYKKT